MSHKKVLFRSAAREMDLPDPEENLGASATMGQSFS